MARIFVCYSRSDELFMNHFVQLIRKKYDDVWFDKLIPPGTNWRQMIMNQINACEVFIYLVSNESLTSSYCQAELREALRVNKPVLPVIVRRLPGNIDLDLVPGLEGIQYLN